ncbi:MAG: XdhC family protein, partial [Cyanobacteria bacterium P01_D01_bin.14]
MPAITSVASAIDDPITFLSQYDGTLAVLTNIEGSSYRQVGTLMAFGTNGIRVSSISSGCFDEALAAEAEAAFVEGTVRQVRYGHGSPFIDIQLPCGAGLDVTFIPQPNR